MRSNSFVAVYKFYLCGFSAGGGGGSLGAGVAYSKDKGNVYTGW